MRVYENTASSYMCVCAVLIHSFNSETIEKWKKFSGQYDWSPTTIFHIVPLILKIFFLRKIISFVKRIENIRKKNLICLVFLNEIF